MMIAELLRLKARLLANAFRVPGTAIGSAVGIVFTGFALAALWGGATLAAELDEQTRDRVVIVAGAMVSLGAFFVPAVIARAQLLNPRAFRPFGWGPFSIGVAVLFTTFLGPALVLVPIALTQLFFSTGRSAWWALLAVPFVVIEGILAARLGVLVGAVLRHRPVFSTLVRIFAAALLIGGLVVIAAHLAPIVAELLPGAWWQTSLTVVLALSPLRSPAIADTLSALPLGAFWRLPMHDGDDVLVRHDLGLGALTIAGLALLWILSLAYSLRPTRRIPRERAALVPGWFRRMPSTPTGAIAARSFSYWRRDPRYQAALAVLPVVPVVTLLACYVAGIPLSVSALIPLPLVVLLLGWATLHNDVAYDSTAVWAHLAAQTRGVHDRVGRMLPVLAMGLPTVIVGTIVTAWAHGDWMVAPAVFGVSIALLLGGIGVSSVISARVPYPATRPGDAPFQQPLVEGASGADIQAGSILLILLVAAPAITATVFEVLGVAGPWNWIALATGLFAGLTVLVLGIRVGGASFDRRAPELLEFAVRH
jgi:ABC-2 type transport system permease protein